MIIAVNKEGLMELATDTLRSDVDNVPLHREVGMSFDDKLTLAHMLWVHRQENWQIFNEVLYSLVELNDLVAIMFTWI